MMLEIARVRKTAVNNNCTTKNTIGEVQQAQIARPLTSNGTNTAEQQYNTTAQLRNNKTTKQHNYATQHHYTRTRAHTQTLFRLAPNHFRLHTHTHTHAHTHIFMSRGRGALLPPPPPRGVTPTSTKTLQALRATQPHVPREMVAVFL